MSPLSFPAERMRAYPISSRVNSVKNGVPELIEAAPASLYYYAAFALDPDGNNMEAVFRGE